MSTGTEIRQLDRIGILMGILIIMYCVVGWSKVRINADNVVQWLPENSEARDRYNIFAEKFQSDDFIVLTWPDCTVDDQRLEEFTSALRSKNSALIQSVTSGAEVATKLESELKLSKKNVYRRLKGVFLGASDPTATCAIVTLSEQGAEDRTRAMASVWDAIDETANLDREEVAAGGYPYIGTKISEELKNSNRRYLAPTMILATFFSFLCLRDLSLMLIVFVAACGSAAVSVATIPMLGVTTGGLLTIIPALVFVLATSGSIHLVRYSFRIIGEPFKLIAIGWKPCVISAVTTSVGMLSLARSNFPAIRNFGFFCALGVLASLVFQLIIVPWLLTRFGQAGLTRMAKRNESSMTWSNLSQRIKSQKWIIGCLFIGGMIFCGFGLNKLTANVEVENMFRSTSELRIKLLELEEHLGPLDQTELLVIFDAESEGRFHERAKAVARIQLGLGKLEAVDSVYSLINFLPAEPKSTSITSFVGRDIYRALLREKRAELKNSGLLHVDEEQGTETWRISMRFPFSRQTDFATVEDEVIGTARAAVAKSDMSPRLIYTGKTHLFNHAQLSLLSDLFKNFLLAFLIITPMLVIALRSIPLGLIAMLPNVFPALVIFGSLGWLAFPVDLAIAMTACVALGIAVDDTTHFLVRFREFGGSLEKCDEAIEQAIGQCGPAMLSTTVIGGAGLIVYAFSDMLLISNFAIFIVLMLVIALIADVFMLPALLYLICREK